MLTLRFLCLCPEKTSKSSDVICECSLCWITACKWYVNLTVSFSMSFSLVELRRRPLHGHTGIFCIVHTREYVGFALGYASLDFANKLEPPGLSVHTRDRQAGRPSATPVWTSLRSWSHYGECIRKVVLVGLSTLQLSEVPWRDT